MISEVLFLQPYAPTSFDMRRKFLQQALKSLISQLRETVVCGRREMTRILNIAALGFKVPSWSMYPILHFLLRGPVWTAPAYMGSEGLPRRLPLRSYLNIMVNNGIFLTLPLKNIKNYWKILSSKTKAKRGMMENKTNRT